MVQCLCLQTTDWHQVTVKELPEQHDGGSCGVFTCMYAKCLLAGSDPTQAFSQNDIPRLRLQMAANLLKAYGLPNAKLPGDLSGMHLLVIDKLHKSQHACASMCQVFKSRQGADCKVSSMQYGTRKAQMYMVHW